jgi:molecular chaperone GrpE
MSDETVEIEQENTDQEQTEEAEQEETEALEEAERTPEEICQDELAEVKAALAEAEEKVLRIHADFENSKKRLEKDKATAVAFANESFAGDMLSILDSFESAFASFDQIDPEDAAEAIAKIKEGMELTYNQTLSVLKKHGVEEVAGEGEFDPEVHQAIMQVESEEHESGHVVQVMQKGYTMKDRTLRAAMVSTAK